MFTKTPIFVDISQIYMGNQRFLLDKNPIEGFQEKEFRRSLEYLFIPDYRIKIEDVSLYKIMYINLANALKQGGISGKNYRDWFLDVEKKMIDASCQKDEIQRFYNMSPYYMQLILETK